MIRLASGILGSTMGQALDPYHDPYGIPSSAPILCVPTVRIRTPKI